MIDYINIKGYKSIKELHLELKPINILIGGNGSGKSNFVSFFDFIHAIYNQKLTEYVGLRGGADRILHQPPNQQEIVHLELSFDKENNGYEINLQKGIEDAFFISSEYLIYNNDQGRNIAKFESEARLKVTDNYRARYVIGYIHSYRRYHFHDTSSNSPFSKMSHVENDSYFLYREGDNLAAYLYTIRENHLKTYNRIVKTIQSIAPFFSDFFLEPNQKGFIRLQWQSKHSDFIYGVNDLSDGTLRFIALTTLFLQPKLPQTIVIDEPELGLHPVAIAKLAGMVQSAASQGAQVILATQSADLISYFQAEDIVTVDQIDGASVFKRLQQNELKKWLDEYSIGELWQQNIIQGGQPNP